MSIAMHATCIGLALMPVSRPSACVRLHACMRMSARFARQPQALRTALARSGSISRAMASVQSDAACSASWWYPSSRRISRLRKGETNPPNEHLSSSSISIASRSVCVTIRLATRSASSPTRSTISPRVMTGLRFCQPSGLGSDFSAYGSLPMRIWPSVPSSRFVTTSRPMRMATS
jgi:hypothetical protein